MTVDNDLGVGNRDFDLGIADLLGPVEIGIRVVQNIDPNMIDLHLYPLEVTGKSPLMMESIL
jgi:hypothetical protein